MELKDLMNVFAEKFAIEGLEPDGEGGYHLSFDGMAVNFLEEPKTNSLVIVSPFAEKPIEGTDRLAEILLGANYLFAATSGNTIAFDSANKTYVLQRREPLAMLDSESFIAVVEDFANALEDYKKLVEDFRPALDEATGYVAKENEEISSLHASGFMQV